MSAIKNKSKRGLFFIIFQIFLGIFDVVLGIIFIGVLTLLYYYVNTPQIKNTDRITMNQTSVIYDRTGQHILYKIFGEENREVISHQEIPNSVRIMTIASEDADFYHHFGIDLKSLIRAIKVNVENDKIKQGASTITQQLARSLFLSREKTLERKLKEAVLAVKIERRFSKDEILDMYLNKVPYGANAYGIQAAAQTYFKKDAKDLTYDEAAFLAVLPNAPTFYLPYGQNKKLLKQKQAHIIKRARQLNLIDDATAESALQTDTFAKLQPLSRQIKAPHFVMFVLKEIEQKYDKDFLEKGGLHIITTLDWDLQKKAEQTLTNHKEALKSFNAGNASLVAINPKNGQILAMVGSLDYFDNANDGQVNVALSVRSPGSSFKPFVYATAFEKGFQPETLLYDVRTNFGPDGSGKNYIPQNYDGKFHGLVSVRQALAMSLNIPAVKMLYLAGIDDTINLARRMGINTLDDGREYGLALALGGGGVKLLEETSAFGVFANDGLRNKPTGIIKISDDDEELFRFEKNQKQVIETETARKINSILSDNEARIPTFGKNNPLTIAGRTVAAKTGTTQDYRDAWTVGYTPNLVAGVWAGNNDNSPMKFGSAGTFVAGPIWNAFMKSALQNRPEEKFHPYTKVTSPIPMISGKDNLPKKTVYYNKKTGKKISPSKARKKSSDKIREKTEPEKHSLLYYYLEKRKNEPNFSNYKEMLQRWEEAL